MRAQDFLKERRRYLAGFGSGIAARRRAQGLRPFCSVGGGAGEPFGPDTEHLAAMARCEAAGQKLSPEERAKRAKHPVGAYARRRFHGPFYVAPAQNSFMCRLRIANGILAHWRLVGMPTSPTPTAAMRTSPRAHTCRSAT